MSHGQSVMRPELVLLVLPVLLFASSAEHVGTTLQHSQEEDSSNHLSPIDTTVTSSLVQVWNGFGNLATSLYKIRLVPDSQQGRGHKGASLIIPLIIGFKLSGAVVAAISALKVIVLKTAAMSSLALLVSLAVGAKHIYDKLQEQQHESTPHYYVPHIKDSGRGSEYEVQAGHATVYTGHSLDLQGHHSSIVPQAVDDLSDVHLSEENDAQRKVFRGSPKFKTVVHKTKYRLNG